MKIITHYTNNTNIPNLANPFNDIEPNNRYDYHRYMRNLKELLLHYHPSIKSILNVNQVNDTYTIYVMMVNA